MVKLKNSEKVYKKIRKRETNPVKINVEKWTICNCRITINLIAQIEKSIGRSCSC